MIMLLSFVVVCFGFIHLEILRKAVDKKSRLGYLNEFMVKFLDNKDSKQLILSHIYLLIGCIWPLVYAQQHGITDYHHKLTGLISLCVSDSLVR